MAEAVGGAGASALSGIGLGIGLGATYGTVVDILRTATTWVKWKALGGWQGYPIIADVLQQILSAEKDEVHGLTAKGMVDTIFSFVSRTMDLAMYLNEAIANQLFTQMVQQSVAYAIHSAHAGSIGTVCNVYSGGESLHGMQLSNVGEYADLADRATKAFLSASTGLNVPSTAFQLTRGVNTRIEQVFSRVMSQIDGLLDEWNDLALDYYRHYHTMARSRFQDALEMYEHITTRAYGFLEQAVREHLARINEQLDTLEGAKAWWDAGLLTDDELKQIAVRIDAERQASEAIWDEYKDEILDGINDSISDWDNYIQQALNDMDDCEYRYNVLIKKLLDGLFTDVREFAEAIIDEVNKTVEDVCAYRNVKQAVTVSCAESLGETESSPEVTIYRLRWRHWREIPAITIIYEYQRPSGLTWSEDLEHDKGISEPEEATVVPRRRFEEVDYNIVTYHTEPTPLTPWESVE